MKNKGTWECVDFFAGIVGWSLTFFSSCAAPPTKPKETLPLKTYAESQEFRATSRLEHVQAFVEGLRSLDLPFASEIEVKRFGESEEGRPLLYVRFGPKKEGVPTVLVNANIHAGEVEGKEAVQILLRELAMGQHGELRGKLNLLFVPIFNVDGNERIDPSHRPDQNGPLEGVGTRANAKGLDLNRDFIKLESREDRALVALLRKEDPEVFMDLHATDGSYHGFHLTYSPSLSPEVDPGLDAFNRGTLLPDVRKAMRERHGFEVFDYGNYRGGDPKKGWITYDPRPRFGTNYVGLRGRLSILSEAYSHLDFQKRVEVTKAFVLECLRQVAFHGEEIQKLCSEADKRAEKGGLRFGYASKLAPPVEEEILLGKTRRVRRPDGTYRIVDLDVHEPLRVPVQRAFRATRFLPFPLGWWIVDPSPEVMARLENHGLRFQTLEKDRAAEVEVFETSRARRARRVFQGHHELSLEGTYRKKQLSIPKGSLYVPAGQALARLAAMLLEPLSEDSLFTWNFFDAQLKAAKEGGEFPVVRVLSWIKSGTPR